jgi:hypothetical protein
MTVKHQFGNWLTRLLWSGDTLYPAEQALLEALVTALPAELRGPVEAQFHAYNLAQREVDGRALNFYRKTRGAVSSDELTLLTLKAQDAPLIRITARVGVSTTPVHAVLNAVGGRAFSVTTDRRLEPNERESSVVVERVVNAWKSNVDLHAET